MYKLFTVAVLATIATVSTMTTSNDFQMIPLYNSMSYNLTLGLHHPRASWHVSLVSHRCPFPSCFQENSWPYCQVKLRRRLPNWHCQIPGPRWHESRFPRARDVERLLDRLPERELLRGYPPVQRGPHWHDLLRLRNRQVQTSLRPQKGHEGNYFTPKVPGATGPLLRVSISWFRLLIMIKKQRPIKWLIMKSK